MTQGGFTHIRAVRDIRRGGHTVVRNGTPGQVLGSHSSWFETTYTVRFVGIGRHHRDAITLIALNEDDVQPGPPCTEAHRRCQWACPYCGQQVTAPHRWRSTSGRAWPHPGPSTAAIIKPRWLRVQRGQL